MNIKYKGQTLKDQGNNMQMFTISYNLIKIFTKYCKPV